MPSDSESTKWAFDGDLLSSMLRWLTNSENHHSGWLHKHLLSTHPPIQARTLVFFSNSRWLLFRRSPRPLPKVLDKPRAWVALAWAIWGYWKSDGYFGRSLFHPSIKILSSSIPSPFFSIETRRMRAFRRLPCDIEPLGSPRLWFFHHEKVKSGC